MDFVATLEPPREVLSHRFSTPADEQPRCLLLADLDVIQMATGVVDPTIVDDTIVWSIVGSKTVPHRRR